MNYNANYYQTNFSLKLKKIINKKYETLPIHKRRGAFENDYYNFFQKDITESVKKWYIGKRKPSLEILMNICNLLDCDIDYFFTEQEDFKKEIKSTAEVTGLEYETIEILEKIKNSKIKDTENYIDKCILFLLDFLLQRANGREILHNMFYYLFKQHNLCYTQPFIFSPSLGLKDTSDISVNDLEINANSFSEQYFYSKLLTDIVTFKEQEKTKSIDIAKTIYPRTEKSYQNILELLDLICVEGSQILPILTNDINTNPSTEKINLFNNLEFMLTNMDRICDQLENEYKESKKYKQS